MWRAGACMPTSPASLPTALPTVEVCPFNSAILTFTTVHMSNNGAVVKGGAVHLEEGVVATVIKRTVFLSNSAEFGGGIASYSSSVDMMESSLLENRANGERGEGGALYVSKGFFTILRCNVTRNTAIAGQGGAFAVKADAGIHTMRVEYSDIIHNEAGVVYDL